MNEFDSPNYTDYTYDKKIEGKYVFFSVLLVIGYVAFVTAFFLICYVTSFVPVFAICPLVTWIIVYFSWRLVKFDLYYTFEHGHMEFGRVRVRKTGHIRTPKMKLEVKDAILAAPLEVAREREEFIKAIKHDYSSYRASSNLIVIVFEGKKGSEAVIFENTPKFSKLLSRYCKNTVGFQIQT